MKWYLPEQSLVRFWKKGNFTLSQKCNFWWLYHKKFILWFKFQTYDFYDLFLHVFFEKGYTLFLTIYIKNLYKIAHFFLIFKLLLQSTLLIKMNKIFSEKFKVKILFCIYDIIRKFRSDHSKIFWDFISIK